MTRVRPLELFAPAFGVAGALSVGGLGIAWRNKPDLQHRLP